MCASKARSGHSASMSVSQALAACAPSHRDGAFGPEVGAVCGKAARTDLCGGRSAMSVPTATEAKPIDGFPRAFVGVNPSYDL